MALTINIKLNGADEKRFLAEAQFREMAFADLAEQLISEKLTEYYKNKT